MDTRFLKSLLVTVEKGSIAEAARFSGLTAAAVGQRIRALENELKVDLLNRVGHNAIPTHACVQMLPRVRRMVQDADNLSGDIDETGLTGTFRIGAISTVLTDDMPEVLRSLQRNHTTLQPYIVPGASKDLYSDLVAEKIDAALTVEPPIALPKSIRKTILREEPLVFLSKKRPTDSILTSLLSEPYIAYDPEAWGVKMIDAYLTKADVEKKPFCILDSPETIAILVCDGVGVTILPRWVGLQRYARKLYISKSLGNEFSRRICLLTHATPKRGPMIKVLKDALVATGATRKR